MRIIPRLKVPGGFELGTGIFVNTQDPKETIEFIKEHFDHPNVEKIKTIHKATYRRGV
jgi:UDPglucose--hexose-1-phosphate uridylyltransferase